MAKACQSSQVPVSHCAVGCENEVPRSCGEERSRNQLHRVVVRRLLVREGFTDAEANRSGRQSISERVAKIACRLQAERYKVCRKNPACAASSRAASSSAQPS